MAETSSIEWTDSTWNVITGCTLVSEGCRHCYAATLAAGRLQNHPSRKGLARVNAAGEAKFTGEVRFNEEWLDQPLRWRRPRMIFVCAHGDLFHESVPDEWIDRVFAVMALAPQHVFQILSKRPERARAYLNDPKAVARIATLVYKETYGSRDKAFEQRAFRVGPLGSDLAGCEAARPRREGRRGLPLRSEDKPMPEGSGRVPDARRISSRLRDHREDQGGLGGAQAGMGAPAWADPARHDNQSPERREGRQQAGELGARDHERAEAARSGCSERAEASADRIGAPENEAQRGGCAEHPIHARERGAGDRHSGSLRNEAEGYHGDLHQEDLGAYLAWPLPNVWLGTSVEDQAAADARITHLLATPASVRFLSAEPLLGPVSLRWLAAFPESAPHTAMHPSGRTDHLDGLRRLDWVIVGGESGRGARPMHPDWARSLRDQCAAAGVPFFFKQWGSWKNGSDFAPDAKIVTNDGRVIENQIDAIEAVARLEPGRTLDPALMRLVGKAAAGRLLDGVEHNGMPEVRP